MNLVSLIMQFLGPAIIGKLASSVGINNTMAQKLIAAAIPTILAALAGKVAQPSGASMLSDIVGKQDPGLLGKLASVIGGPQQKQIADQGSNVLGSLLGNSALGSLAGALTKFSGVGEAPTKTLLGMLAPVVLGTLAQQQKSSNLDAGGLARMLMGQKDNISQAIPADFAKLLGGTGLLDSLGSSASKAAEPAAKSMASATPSSSASTPARTAVPVARASAFNWWPWLIAIGLAGAAWWYLFAVPRPQLSTIPTVPRVMVGSTDVGGQVETSLKGLQGLLASIKDPQSAQNALPRLRDTQVALDKISGDVSGDAKRQIATYVAQWLPTLTPLINSLLANSAIAPLVKPVLDNLTKRLEAMAKG